MLRFCCKPFVCFVTTKSSRNLPRQGGLGFRRDDKDAGTRPRLQDSYLIDFYVFRKSSGTTPRWAHEMLGQNVTNCHACGEALAADPARQNGCVAMGDG